MPKVLRRLNLRKVVLALPVGTRVASKLVMNVEANTASGHGGEDMKRGKYLAMLRPDGNVVRFIIRDRAGVRPSIHGYGHSMEEARNKIEEIFGALDNLEEERAA